MAEKFKDIPNESVYFEQLSPSLQKMIRSAVVMVSQLNLTTGEGGAKPVTVDYVFTDPGALLTGSTLIDGAIRTGGRVLVVNRNDSRENGIYDINAASAWTRSSDVLFSGMVIAVCQGQRQHDTLWMLTEPESERVANGQEKTFINITPEYKSDQIKGLISLVRSTTLHRIKVYVADLYRKFCEYRSATESVVWSANTLKADTLCLNNIETFCEWQNVDVASDYVSHSLGTITVYKAGIYFIDTMVYDEKANTSGTMELAINCEHDHAIPTVVVDRFTNTYCDVHGSRMVVAMKSGDTFNVSLKQNSGATWTLHSLTGAYHNAWVRIIKVSDFGGSNKWNIY